MSAGDKKSKSKKSAARKRAAQGVSLTDALAEAAWSEADAALAQALADFDEADTADGKAARKDAMARLGQALSRAGRKRGLARVGELDEEVDFDAEAYDLNAAVAKTPKTVRIQARGVTRGGEMLAKPRVAPVDRNKRS
ncbi:MAG: hypothetical protein KA153_02345 [Hyphomonadaceae bacterium]|jgi:hypothetical protein|nr:hypothetical protein [Caulobacteraceae bacterium]MBP6688806.1 hypothetical protein [Hyphomonadaceae bacterium]